MTKRFIKPAGVLYLAFVLFSACTGKQDNQLTEKEKKEGWTLLFDGHSLNGWHLYNSPNGKSTWSVINGELTCGPDIRFEHYDLVTDKEYKNFELAFDWKINKGGNSGVFIDVIERPDIPATWASGPEYQLLESSHPDYAIGNKRSGALYSFIAPLDSAAPTLPGQWNESRIKQQDGHVEFYLNGVLTAKQDFTSKTWLDSVATSHFNRYPEFGHHTSGHIALQDWQKEVSFKNIRIREW